MVTAFASIELAVDAMKLGATDFLRKPMTPEALRSAVAAALAAAASARGGPRAAASGSRRAPRIQTLTLNGFQILPARGRERSWRRRRTGFVSSASRRRRMSTVVVTIDPEIVARVERLTRRTLPPAARFWRGQAERLLAAYLWSEGQAPERRR